MSFVNKKVMNPWRMLLCLSILFLLFFVSSCLKVKQPEVVYPVPEGVGPEAVFQDDFAFAISEDTPDINSVVPPTRAGCNVLLLCQGQDDYKIRKKLLRNARLSIAIQTYIFTNDPVGQKVGDILKKQRSKGLDVRLIIDAYTKFKPNDRILYFDLERAGVDVAGFEPIYFMGVTESSYFEVEEVNRRFHEKYFIVDDAAAIIGGRNIADEYACHGKNPDNQWRDQDVVLTGPVVKDIRNAFEENYKFFLEREDTRPALVNPPWWRKLWRKITGRKVIGRLKRDPSELEPDFKFLDFTANNVPVRFIRSRPRLNETYIYQAYMYLIRSARNSILIENAYFVPDQLGEDQ
jgi:phosphatidylserine/phosphatidylglycerophosphate/cardiolipin synthase-like enzyme